MTIGKRIQQLRTDHKENQGELAQKIGKKQSNISKIERDEVKPTLDIIEMLCDHYNVSADYLIFGRTPEIKYDFLNDPRYKYLNTDEKEQIEYLLNRAKKRHDDKKYERIENL